MNQGQTWGPVQNGASPRLLENGGNNSWGICHGGPCDEEPQKPKYQYAGPNKGGWRQECTYKQVPYGKGDYEVQTVRKKPRNYTLCFGLAASLIIMAFLGYAARAQPAVVSPKNEVKPTEASRKYGCFPEGLDEGEIVRAAAAISFEPAGLVQEGAMGKVVMDGPDGDEGRPPAERAVIVTWDGIPGLKNSKVTRDMIVRTIQEQDAVESLASFEYRMKPGYKAPPAPLEVADLVRATQDLGSVREGTYGTIVAVMPDTPDRAVVSFATQLDTVKVHETHIVKVPQVRDQVRALSDINGKDFRRGGVVSVPAGSLGYVSAVTPTNDGLAYTFAVDWSIEGKPRVEAQADSLQVLLGRDGEQVMAGSRGKVIEAPENNPKEPRSQGDLFVVDWDDQRGPGSLVRRDQLKRSSIWSKDKLDYCCGAGKYCPKNGDGGADSPAPVKKPQPVPAQPDFDCALGAPATWAVDKAHWCCTKKAVGCIQDKGGESPPAPPTPVAPPPPPPPSGGGIA